MRLKPGDDDPVAFRDSAERTFYESLIHNDGMIAVLRGHLYIESALHDILRARLGHDVDAIIKNRGFADKFGLARRLRLLTKEQTRALQALNELRNSFAHTLERSLTLEDDEKIFNALDQQSRAEARKYFEKHPDQKTAGALVRFGILMIQAEMISEARVLNKFREQGRDVVKDAALDLNLD